jgi:hypothetical protein
MEQRLEQRRVAAVFADDLRLSDDRPGEDAAGLAAHGYELLALDRPAAVHLIGSGLPFQTVEDWIDDGTGSLTDIYRSTEALTSRLFEVSAERLTTDEVTWVAEDYFTVQSILMSSIISVRLAGALRDAGVTEVRCTSGHAFDLSAPNQHPQPVVSSILARMLQDVIAPVAIPRPRPVERARRIVSSTLLGAPLRAARTSLAVRRFRSAAKRSMRSRGSGDLVVLMLAMRELDRSGPVVRSLSSRLGADLIAIPWMNASALTQEAGELAGIDWLPTPPLERGAPSVERRLAAGITAALSACDLGELEPVRAEVTAAFLALAVRWGAHARRLAWATAALRLLRPRLVIASRDDLEYQLPIEAARLTDTPFMTLPHGVVHWVPPHRFRPDSRGVHLSGIMNPTAPAGALRVTRDVLITYEYPRRRETVDVSGSPTDGLTILALTDGFGRTNQPSIDLRSQQRALRMLATAARSVGEDVRVLLKTHPAMDERAEPSLLDAQSASVIRSLPRSADLMQLVAACDLVVAVNMTGSALVHVVEQGVPVVRLRHHPAYAEFALPSSGSATSGEKSWQEFWDSALLTVDDADELAEALHRFRQDPGFNASLVRRSVETSAMLHPIRGGERLESILDELLP